MTFQQEIAAIREQAEEAHRNGGHLIEIHSTNVLGILKALSEGPRAPVTANGRDDLYTQATVDDYERELAGLKSYAIHLKEALTWYGERAADIVRYAKEKKDAGIEAIFVELTGDAGRRMHAALNREPSVVIDNKGAGSALLPAVERVAFEMDCYRGDHKRPDERTLEEWAQMLREQSAGLAVNTEPATPAWRASCGQWPHCDCAINRVCTVLDELNDKTDR